MSGVMSGLGRCVLMILILSLSACYTLQLASDFEGTTPVSFSGHYPGGVDECRIRHFSHASHQWSVFGFSPPDTSFTFASEMQKHVDLILDKEAKHAFTVTNLKVTLSREITFFRSSNANKLLGSVEYLTPSVPFFYDNVTLTVEGDVIEKPGSEAVF